LKGKGAMRRWPAHWGYESSVRWREKTRWAGVRREAVAGEVGASKSQVAQEVPKPEEAKAGEGELG
jgi:hypothetical protein